MDKKTEGQPFNDNITKSEFIQEQLRPSKLSYMRNVLRPRVAGRHGSAPMSNKIARFVTILNVLVSVVLPIIEYRELANPGDKIYAQLRNPAEAWAPGFYTSLIGLVVLVAIVLLDRFHITQKPLLPSRSREKLIWAGLAVVITLVMGGLALFS